MTINHKNYFDRLHIYLSSELLNFRGTSEASENVKLHLKDIWGASATKTVSLWSPDY